LLCGEPRAELSEQLVVIAKMLAGMTNRVSDGDFVREESEPYDVQ